MCLSTLLGILVGLALHALAVDYKARTFPEWQVRLQNPTTEVRQEAAAALGFFGAQAIQPLIQALKDSQNVVAGSAMYALVRIGPEAVPELALKLRDADGTVAFRAAEALGKIGPASVPALVHALRYGSPDEWVRVYNAGFFMIPDGKAAAAPALADLLEDSDNEVRMRAMKLLGYMYPELERAIPALMKSLRNDNQLQGMAKGLLIRLGPKAMPALVEGLRDSDTKTRRAVVQVLGSMDRRDVGLTALELRRLCMEDPDSAVRSGADSALKKFVGGRPRTQCPEVQR